MPKPAAPRHNSAVEEVVLIIVIILCLVGIAVTDFSPQDAFVYWMSMIFVFGICAMVTGWFNAKLIHDPEEEGHKIKEMFVDQFLHWLGALVAVGCLFSFIEAERIDQETTSLMVLLILALATYLDGIRIGWRFSVAGIYLALTAVAANFIDTFMPWLVVLALVIIGVTVYFEKRRRLQ
jgi:putative Mn2+ efflux pump MntP